jgi:hypothetical protein
MNELRARGVSLWLMPTGEPRDRLASLIVRLAERFSTPPFPPHVTLLPGIEKPSEDDVLSTSRALAVALRPFPLRLLAVEGKDEPFRCLFVRAAADEPLVAAHAAASCAFGRRPDAGFLPHLSLVYGRLPDDAKADLAAALSGLVASRFPVARLHVWRTEGPVAEWQELGALDLAGG